MPESIHPHVEPLSEAIKQMTTSGTKWGNKTNKVVNKIIGSLSDGIKFLIGASYLVTKSGLSMISTKHKKELDQLLNQ